MQDNLKRLLLEPVILVTEARDRKQWLFQSYFEDELEVIAAV